MKTRKRILGLGPVLAGLLAVSGTSLHASGIHSSESDQGSKTRVLMMPLDSMDGLEVRSIRENGLEPVKTTADIVAFQGRRALRIINDPGVTAEGTGAGDQVIAIVNTSEFREGTIEADIAGLPRAGAPLGTPGFVGIAFRVQNHGSRYEAFYLRPGNSHSGDQLHRNHSIQYVSWPDFPWKRLRDESPGVYESYADIAAHTWIRMKIVVTRTTARLYINGADEPCLIVNDLKLGDSHGQVALYSSSDTEAYFSNLTIK